MDILGKIFRWAGFLVVAALLAACGGGGGGGDTTPPVVTTPANINVAAGSVSGTPVTDATIATFLAAASALDNVDGAVSVTNNAPITFPAATTTTVTFSASDTTGNIGTATATVTVGVFGADITPPVVTAPANITVAASSVSGTPATDATIAVFLANTSATDNVDGAVSVTNNAPVTFPAATTTTVTFSASDTAGNIGAATATVTVGVFGGSTSWNGTKQLGTSTGVTKGHSIATDANGNVYVAGDTTGSLDGNTLIGAQDFFVTKYNSSGVKQYTHQLGVVGANTYGTSVATDTNGNVYVAGYTNSNLDGNTLTGARDFFVTKYDSTGVKQYTHQLGVVGANTYGTSVATDTNGNVYVAGYTGALVPGLSQDGLDGNTQIGAEDFFVTKYDSTGAKQYTRQLGSVTGNTLGNSVATDADGNVYVAGVTTGGLDGNMLTGAGDFFVTKYNSSGVKQYTRQLGVALGSLGLGTGVTTGTSVATDANGNVYVAGVTNGGLDGNAQIGTFDFFVTKYNSIGAKQYTRQLGQTLTTTIGNSVATDTDGNVYVTGVTYGALDGNTQIGSTDFFITKYDSTGTKQYTRQLGAELGVTSGNSVATDADGNVYVAGYTQGFLDGNTPVGNLDFFITKYDSAGIKQ